MPVAGINGQQLYYEDSGGQGLPVVLSHGLLMDHEMFAPQLAALRSEYRVVTWDERCHGLTESTTDPFTYWDSADDLAGLFDHLGIERAVLGGMSQGGFLSLRFALRHPQRVRALVFFDSQASPEDPDKAETYGVMLDVWEAEGLYDPMAETIAAILFGSDWPGRGPWIEKWRHQPRERLRPSFNTLVGREDIHDRLNEIKAPALVIHGTADTAIDMELAERLCSGLANCRGVVQIEGAGHSANLTHPELVNRALLAFLSQVVSPPRERGGCLPRLRRGDPKGRSRPGGE
jgi:pimeloyl-ACP methyl ester carboxylesterase